MKSFQSLPLILLAFVLIPSSCILVVSLIFSQPNLLCVALSIVILLIALLCAWQWSSQMVVQARQLYYASRRDDLTGVFLRNALEEQVNRQLGVGSTAYAFFLFDVDNFQQFNQQLGHLRGDQALVGLADELRYVFPDGTLIGRIGSNTFAAFILDGQSQSSCRVLMEQLSIGLRKRASLAPGLLTLSSGISLAAENDSFQTLYHRADQALCHSKQSGKDRYCFDFELAYL